MSDLGPRNTTGTRGVRCEATTRTFTLPPLDPQALFNANHKPADATIRVHRCYLFRDHDGAHEMDPDENARFTREWHGPPDPSKAGVSRYDAQTEKVYFQEPKR